MISVSELNKRGYCFSFGNRKYSFFQNENFIGNGSLSSYANLYLVDIVASFNESLHVNEVGKKRKLTNENSTSLWHKD